MGKMKDLVTDVTVTLDSLASGEVIIRTPLGKDEFSKVDVVKVDEFRCVTDKGAILTFYHDVTKASNIPENFIVVPESSNEIGLLIKDILIERFIDILFKSNGDWRAQILSFPLEEL